MRDIKWRDCIFSDATIHLMPWQRLCVLAHGTVVVDIEVTCERSPGATEGRATAEVEDPFLKAWCRMRRRIPQRFRKYLPAAPFFHP